MKKLWDLKNVLSYLELEGQGRGIIMEVTRPLLLVVKWPCQPKHFGRQCTLLWKVTYFQFRAILNWEFWRWPKRLVSSSHLTETSRLTSRSFQLAQFWNWYNTMLVTLLLDIQFTMYMTKKIGSLKSGSQRDAGRIMNIRNYFLSFWNTDDLFVKYIFITCHRIKVK